jgi:hypothetical protein
VLALALSGRFGRSDKNINVRLLRLSSQSDGIPTATRKSPALLSDLEPVERNASERIGLVRETEMPQSNHDPKAGEQVPARPHDPGSQANETVEGLDAETEALRHATEDTPAGTGPGKIEKTPVFDRAGLAPKI